MHSDDDRNPRSLLFTTRKGRDDKMKSNRGIARNSSLKELVLHYREVDGDPMWKIRRRATSDV